MRCNSYHSVDGAAVSGDLDMSGALEYMFIFCYYL